MKKPLIVVFILFSFAIKAQQNKSDKDTFNTIIGEIDKRDLNCSSEIEKAKNDFKSKETFYVIDPQGCLSLKAKRYYPFLFELLKKKEYSFYRINRSRAIIFLVRGQWNKIPTKNKLLLYNLQ